MKVCTVIDPDLQIRFSGSRIVSEILMVTWRQLGLKPRRLLQMTLGGHLSACVAGMGKRRPPTEEGKELNAAMRAGRQGSIASNDAQPPLPAL